MEKNKMKKLVLKKDVVANLNDYHMNHLRGGSSYVCVTIDSVVLTYDITAGTIDWKYTYEDLCKGTYDDNATCPVSCGGNCPSAEGC